VAAEAASLLSARMSSIVVRKIQAARQISPRSSLFLACAHVVGVSPRMPPDQLLQVGCTTNEVDPFREPDKPSNQPNRNRIMSSNPTTTDRAEMTSYWKGWPFPQSILSLILTRALQDRHYRGDDARQQR
jgi:hypothetical protein